MKKKLLLFWLMFGATTSLFSQNYVSGTVSLHGDNTASGTTTVAPGGSLFLYNNKLYESGDFINRGDSTAISADSGMLVLNGTSPQTVTGRFKIGALHLDNSSGASITADPVITTMITLLDSLGFGNVSNVNFNAGNGLLTLRSTAQKTARVADLTHGDFLAGNTITGKVIVERFIQSRRAWRLLGPPTTADSAGGQTIKEAWQEGAMAALGSVVNPHPGYGTLVTRPGYKPASATGYDDGVPYSTTYSLNMYYSSGLYTQPPNTNLTRFSPHAAYLVMVRGDRSVPPEEQVNGYATPPTVTTLRSKGSLFNGNVSVTVTNTGGKFAGVANPYASTIDFSKVNISGITNGFYVWDPTIGTLGAWLYVDGDDNYNATPNVPPSIGAYTNPATNRLIQSGQAILVKPIGSAGSITFTESNKNISSRSNTFRLTPLPAINVSLYAADGNGGYIYTDGTATVFDDGFSKAAVADEDVFKPGNVSENLSFYTKGSFLMKEKWPMPSPADTLPLQLWKTSVKKYRLVAETNDLPLSPRAYLTDNYRHTSTPLSATDGSLTYDFELNNDAASKATDRFAIVFAGAKVLPVMFTGIKAYPVNDGISITWDVQNESGIAVYEVEKSGDGKTFAKIGTVTAKGSGEPALTYSLFDAQPAVGDNYYRIKSIDLNKNFKYTNIVKASIESGIMTVEVLPNPIRNNTLAVRLSGARKGDYTLLLSSMDGKKLFTRILAHAGGTATYSFNVTNLAKGIYNLQVFHNSNRETRTVRVTVE